MKSRIKILRKAKKKKIDWFGKGEQCQHTATRAWQNIQFSFIAKMVRVLLPSPILEFHISPHNKTHSFFCLVPSALCAAWIFTSISHKYMCTTCTHTSAHTQVSAHIHRCSCTCINPTLKVSFLFPGNSHVMSKPMNTKDESTPTVSRWSGHWDWF